MGRQRFSKLDFLAAARAVAIERGPAAVTVGSVTRALGAPTGSFYYRFPSLDLLLGELWLVNVLAFQEGFAAAIDADDGLSAALHVSRWARAHLDDARLLLLYSRHDFVAGDWPKALRKGVADQARRIEECLAKFTRGSFGSVGPKELGLARFVLVGAPLAAVRPHLEKGEAPPLWVDELIRATYQSIRAIYLKPHRPA